MALEDGFLRRQIVIIQMSSLNDEIEKRHVILTKRSLKTKVHVHVIIMFI